VADVLFSGVAVADTARADTLPPVWDHTGATCSATYCHGSASPKWTQVDSTWNACGMCHGIPPPSDPHWEGMTINQCNLCHATTIDDRGIIINPANHVNGVLNRN